MKTLILTLIPFILTQIVFFTIIKFANTSLSYDISNHLYSSIFLLSLIIFFKIINISKKTSLHILFSFIIAIFFTVNITTFYYFGEFVSYHHIAELFNNSAYFSALARDYAFKNLYFYILVSLLFLGSFISLIPFKGSKTKFKTVLLSLLIVAFSFKLITFNNLDKLTMPFSSTALALYKVARKGIKITHLKFTKREPLKGYNNTKLPFNIFIIIHESWAKNGGSLWGGDKNIMPCLREEVTNDNSHILFNNAYANSSATDVSIPTIVTGLAPYKSLEQFSNSPFIWEYAPNNSAYLTAQDLSWANLRNYFNSAPPTLLYDAISSRHKIIHDIGIDDHHLFQDLYKLINTKNNKSLVVVFTNSMHAPFQRSSTYIPKKIPFERSDYKAAYIADHAYCSFINKLKKENNYKNSLIILTADHGDTAHPSHKSGRITSFYNEIINIPFIIKLPETNDPIFKEKFKQIKNNSTSNVANIDIFPTILDLLNITPPTNQLDGYSLSEKIPNQRPIVSLNTNEFRSWKHEGFSIVINHMHLIISETKGIELFNNKSDPLEKTNLYTHMNQLGQFQKTINNSKLLTKIFEKVKSEFKETL